MWWFCQAFVTTKRWAAFLVLLGVGLEFLQGLGHHRVFEVMDMAANTLGVACGALLASTAVGHTLVWVERCLHLRVHNQ